MAKIRQVAQSKITGKWAYVEVSDEDKNYCVVLGNEEFDDQESAVEHSKCFDIEGYEKTSPEAVAEARAERKRKAQEHINRSRERGRTDSI